MENQPQPNHRIRKDGWTIERQLSFLATLHSTRSVTAAAGAAGMSRESAYRLCNRRENQLFAALWELALQPDRAVAAESHGAPLTTGRIMRVLGNHYRRQSNGFFPAAARGKNSA
jgi:hypothetical protein